MTRNTLSSLLLALLLFPASDLMAQVTRTDWQMHKGQGVIPLKLDSGMGHGAQEAYARADIPSKDDPGWVAPPNRETINFGGGSSSQINKAMCPAADGSRKPCGCWEAVDYTYFQTFVTVPPGTEVKEFTIAFDGMDDGSRVSIFDESGAEKLIESSYVKLGGRGTTNLAQDVQQPGTYRVVITQVDDCPTGNTLRSAKVVLNGKDIPNTAPPPTTPVVPNSHGDVHISTPDGLVFDFQAAGEFYLVRSGGPEVIVQARQEMWEENPKVSVNTAAAMMVDGDKLEFYLKPEHTLYINDKRTDWPSSQLTLPKGGTISPSGNNARRDLTIMWPDGSFGARVIMYGTSHIDLGAAKMKDGVRNYGGIIGNLDGNAQNDMKVRYGDQLTPPANITDLNRFGDSWRVPAGQSLFRGGSTAPVKPERQITVMDLDAEKRAEAKQTCQQAGVTDKLALGNCTYDVAQTGHKAFVESAKVFEQATKAAPPQVKVPGDAAARAAITGSIFPISERFELEQGAKYFSESGLHYLSLQDDGNLVVKTVDDRYVWGIQNSGKEWSRNNRAFMQEDGNLVTYDGNEPIWATDTYGKAGATLTLTPAGELHIIYRGKTIWNSAETEYK